MASKIKAVIFDFFDVIHTDHQKAWLKQNNYLREGEFASASDDLDRGVITHRTYLERYAAAHGSGTADDILNQFNELASINTGVIDIILELRERQYKIGLVSNAHADELEPLLKKHSFHDLFDEIVISGNEGVAKPDAEIFKRALKLLDASPEESIFTDDNEKNVKGAIDVGMTGILFTTAAKLREDLSKMGVL